MKITPNIRALIRSGLATKGIPCVALTDHLNRPKSFSTKLFNGDLKNLTDDDADAICDFLDIRFVHVTETGRVSDTAVRLTAIMDADEKLASMMMLMLDYLEQHTSNMEGLTDVPRSQQQVVTDGHRTPASDVKDRNFSLSRNKGSA